MCVYMPLADFSPDQLEERTRTGQSMLFMVTQDLYIYVGAGKPVSIYADYFLSVLTGVAGCVRAHTCVYAYQEYALSLATG